jgi:hypothetical protein
VNADLADLKGPRIKIHFIQFESKGHQGRDPRQVEVNCVTDGHYQFVSSNGVDKAHGAFCTTADMSSAACCEGACTVGKCDLSVNV